MCNFKCKKNEYTLFIDVFVFYSVSTWKLRELTRKELATLRELEQKDASNVIYSAIKKQIANHRPFETLSWPWWVVLGILTFGIIWLFFAAFNKRKKSSK
ncbi:hypothetical protein [Mycoplasmopsis gallopavonis]|uniref:Uncharacterized protein n=1 Tax=Mycoplasmopsis gallopavonis TaxID=76629 RepID=A0A449AZW1_9BACT|nr:hypothetical protein [Mycoplasmopsis gallopavonis]RIV16171.1 hypothetical protein D1113_03280 [Mycoplasmopsis gallopavonis]VEU73037.1 Uncharacterised protein [Mycoplasmopsis gallopavonis]